MRYYYHDYHYSLRHISTRGERMNDFHQEKFQCALTKIDLSHVDMISLNIASRERVSLWYHLPSPSLSGTPSRHIVRNVYISKLFRNVLGIYKQNSISSNDIGNKNTMWQPMAFLVPLA
jgi:hypothetical protein